MGMNFPATPNVGDVYPTPAQVGLPQYTWDGNVWKSGTIDTANYLPKLGGTMTGPLVLAGNPNAALEAVPRQWAAPVDALAYSGMQVNGALDVSQERGTTGTNVSNTYFCDQWIMAKIGTMAVTASTQPLAGKYPGLPNAAWLSVQTGQPVMTANDRVVLFQAIEGYRAARLQWGTANALPLTVCFWSSHTRAGIYSLYCNNGAGDRYLVTSYTQNVASAVEFKTVTIPGDTAGTWITNNGQGPSIGFTMAAGSSITASAGGVGVWSAAGNIAVPGQVNNVQTTSDVCSITGVMIFPGIDAPPASRAPFILRPYDQELIICRRYLEYQRQHAVWTASTANCYGSGTSPLVPKRTTPTVTLANAYTLNVAAARTTQFTDQWLTTYGLSIAAGTTEFIDDAKCDARF